MIQTEQVCFAYPGGKQALRDVTATFADGCLTAVLGGNGAGKTTLFRCLLRSIRPQTGKILLDGKEANRMSNAELASKIAYVPQRCDAPPDMTVTDFVLLGTMRTLPVWSQPGKEQYRRAEEALEQMELSELRNARMGEISGGQRQMALIARALAQRAGCLLLDEPVSSLDFGNQRRFMDMAKRLKSEGRTVILSVHQPQLALDYADGVLALRDGSVAAQGGADCVTGELLRDLYGVDVSVRTIDGKRMIF